MTSLERFFIDLSANFIAGEFRDVLACFDLPMAIYVGDDVIVCSREDELRAAIERYRNALQDCGIRSADARAAAVPLMRGESGTIWMDVTHRDAEGQAVDGSQIRYFFRRRFGAPRICMLEFLELPAAVRSLDIYRAA